MGAGGHPLARIASPAGITGHASNTGEGTGLLHTCQISSRAVRVERTRLDPHARRLQIIEVAAREFAAKPYGEVQMTNVAEAAGVSRALVYRYFPTKRHLFAAVYEQAAATLVAVSTAGTAAPLLEQVSLGLDAHLDFFEENARTVLVANRGELAGDPVIESIISRELAELRQSMLETLGLQGHDRVVASAALHGWLGFVRAVCVEWLAEGLLSRGEVRELCLRALMAVLGDQPDGSRTPGDAAS